MSPLSRLGPRGLLATAAGLALLLGTVLVLPSPVWTSTPPVGPAGSTHIHASLFFHVDGTAIEPTDAFLEQAQRVHFHAPDNIIHVHATGITLGHALDTLPAAVDGDCITVQAERTCAGSGETVTVLVNGDPVDPAAAKRRVIRQGDTITLFHGTDPAALPDRFHDNTLPPALRPGQPGEPV